jgi:predicted nuclease with RNAse H fold
MASACSAPMPRKDAPVSAPEKRTITEDFFARKQPADEALFLQGLSLLPESLKNNDYNAVKHSFTTLINDHPKSKWRDNVYMLLRFIEDLESYRDKLFAEGAALNKTLTDQAKTLQENEQLKKDIRLLNEKFQAELTTLQQENEQLKKDLQLLKNLEMQLEKREKTLR